MYKSTELPQEFPISRIITIHYFEYMKNFVFSGESHDFWEFLYVDKGEVTVQADDRHYPLNAGDIIFHKPQEFHAIRATGNKAPNLVAISFICESPAMAFFENCSCTLNDSERILISKIIAEARISFATPLYSPAVEQIIVKPDPPFGSTELILLYLRTLLIYIERSLLSHNCQIPHSLLTAQSTASANDSRIEEIVRYMEYHICDKISVEDICHSFNISRSTLHALFQKTKGCGAIDFFNQMKIQRAQELIRDSSMNFTEIAHVLSYSSLQYFSKQFKNATGMSPLEYHHSVRKYSDALTFAAKSES